jgi:DNA gyrase subunit A
LIEKIADLIISKKIPLIVDIRDESTTEIRIVLELATSMRVDKDAEMAMAYLYKNTPLQSNFNVNLTALVPTSNPFVGKPLQLSLREMLEHFVVFRVQVTRAKLEYEKRKLEERIHLLEGLIKIIDVLDKVIKIVRKSKGRTDAAQKLIAEFKLSELQAFFIVDLRIYQLSKTNIEEVEAELNEKLNRVAEINKLLKSEKALKGEVSADLERISKEYGDDRKSQLIGEVEEIEIKEEEFQQHEDVHVIVTKDGWIKRVRTTTDPAGTRFRDGDGLFFTAETNTKHALAIFTNYGNVFVQKIFDLSYTSGFGDPVQKLYKFKDGEQISSCMIVESDSRADEEIFIFSKGGLGFRLSKSVLTETNKNGKRLARLKDGDEILGVISVSNDQFVLISEQGYGLCFPKEDVPVLSNAGKGVILIKLPKGDRLVVASSVSLKDKISILVDKGAPREINVSEMEVGTRAKRGLKIVKRNLPVLGQG